MEKSENRLVQIFEELQGLGLLRTRKEMAELMEVDRTTLSSAMNNNSSTYTPSMIVRAEKLRSRLLSGEPAPAPAPAPPSRVEELSPAEMLRIIGGQADTIRSQQEVIARLLGAAEAKKGAV